MQMCKTWLRQNQDARYYLLDLNAGDGPTSEHGIDYPGTVATALAVRANVLPGIPTTFQGFEIVVKSAKRLQQWLAAQPPDPSLQARVLPVDHFVAPLWCQSSIPAPFWLPRGAIIHDPNGCPMWYLLDELLSLPQTRHLDLFIYVNGQAINRVRPWLQHPSGALTPYAHRMRENGRNISLTEGVTLLRRHKTTWYIQAPHGHWHHAWVFGLNYRPRGGWPSADIYDIDSPLGKAILTQAEKTTS